MNLYHCTLIIFLIILPRSFGSNILVVLPHISYSHFKATSKLVTALEVKGHNITVVSPFQIEGKGHRNITEISLDKIVDPIKRFKADFFEKNNDPSSYWSKLQYAKEAGSTYASHVLNNENVIDLINSNPVFNLVLLEDVSADALTILSHIFKCPLVVLLSEPLSVYYDNYFLYNTQWRKSNKLRTAHHYVVKEIYRKWIIVPEQNKIVTDIFPKAPNIQDVLYNTSMVLIPSYPTESNLVSKYLNVKAIGGFHIGNEKNMPPRVKNPNHFKPGRIVISDDIKISDLDLFFKEIMLQDIVRLSNITGEEILGQPNISLFIGNGDIYDTAYAIQNGIPVLSVLYNCWFQQFLIDTLVEQNAAFRIPVNKLKSNDLKAVAMGLLLNNTRYQEQAELASQIILSEQIYHPIDVAVFWIEYVIKFQGAPHLRPDNLRSHLNTNLLELIILLIVIDIVLFLLFYWIIKHFPNLIFGIKKTHNAARNVFRRNNYFGRNISYIRMGAVRG